MQVDLAVERRHAPATLVPAPVWVLCDVTILWSIALSCMAFHSQRQVVGGEHAAVIALQDDGMHHIPPSREKSGALGLWRGRIDRRRGAPPAGRSARTLWYVVGSVCVKNGGTRI